MDEKSVKDKLATVREYDRTVERTKSQADIIFDNALAKFEAGKINLQEFNEIINSALTNKDNLDPAGSCRAITAARDAGHFIRGR